VKDRERQSDRVRVGQWKNARERRERVLRFSVAKARQIIAQTTKFSNFLINQLNLMTF
jgi:hypothetical protein